MSLVGCGNVVSAQILAIVVSAAAAAIDHGAQRGLKTHQVLLIVCGQLNPSNSSFW